MIGKFPKSVQFIKNVFKGPPTDSRIPCRNSKNALVKILPPTSNLIYKNLYKQIFKNNTFSYKIFIAIDD